MTRDETEAIVRQLAVLDNRHVTNNVIDTWHKLIGHISFPVADRALQKALQDAAINWVEPKHVIAKVRDAVMEMNEEVSGPKSYEFDGEPAPQPTCVHSLPLTTCSDCCLALSRAGERLRGDALQAWAEENVFAREVSNA